MKNAFLFSSLLLGLLIFQSTEMKADDNFYDQGDIIGASRIKVNVQVFQDGQFVSGKAVTIVALGPTYDIKYLYTDESGIAKIKLIPLAAGNYTIIARVGTESVQTEVVLGENKEEEVSLQLNLSKMQQLDEDDPDDYDDYENMYLD